MLEQDPADAPSRAKAGWQGRKVSSARAAADVARDPPIAARPVERLIGCADDSASEDGCYSLSSAAGSDLEFRSCDSGPAAEASEDSFASQEDESFEDPGPSEETRQEML